MVSRSGYTYYSDSSSNFQEWNSFAPPDYRATPVLHRMLSCEIKYHIPPRIDFSENTALSVLSCEINAHCSISWANFFQEADISPEIPPAKKIFINT
jgi:hypothetical protein